MAWFTIPTALLVVTLCVSSAMEKDILEVLYPQRTITSARGSSVALSCKASYDFERCGLLHVVWCNLNNQSAELTDPRKYFTVVNETISDGMRLREVVTEILNLTAEDNAQFQCKAECGSGDKAMGHIITLTVTD